MQLGSKETENERFAHYLTKTYRKTASLVANSLKAVCTVMLILIFNPFAQVEAVFNTKNYVYELLNTFYN